MNPGFSSTRKETSDASSVSIAEDGFQRCLDTHAMLRESRTLDLAINRWRKCKRPTTIDEQLIDLRIALELLLLSDDKRDAEKRHRLAARGAWLLGKTFEERKKHLRTFRDAYDYASGVVHGGRLDEEKSKEIKETATKAQDLCREAIFLLAKGSGKPNWSDLILGRGHDCW